MMWFISSVFLFLVLLMVISFLMGKSKFKFPKNWDKATMEIKLKFIKRQMESGTVNQQQYKILYKMIHREEADRRFKEEQLQKKKRSKKSEASKKGSGKKRTGTKSPTGKKAGQSKGRSGKKKPPAKTSSKKRSPAEDPHIIRPRKFAKTPKVVEAVVEDDYDFEADLREEVGMNETKELDFEEELRRIDDISRARRQLRTGPLEEILLTRTDSGLEYKLPTAKIVETDFKEGMGIDEIFLMNQDGMLIKHFAFSRSSIIDEDLLASMLMVIQNFVIDSFGNREATDLKQLHMGDFNLSINKGEYFIAVAISRDENLKNIEKAIEHMLREMENINQAVMQDWNGDLDAFKGIDLCIEKLIDDEY